MSASEHPPDDCGCCEGVRRRTPAPIENPAGQTELRCRVGTHGQFKQSMQAALAGEEAMRGLKTRRDDDPTLGVLDAAATLLDVLTFYRERITNEGYLRTAKEHRSLIELSGAIGYKLGAGVAASTFLAFTLETPPPGPPQPAIQSGVPRQVTLPIGMKAQSVPAPNEQPQIFETVEEIVARPEWNKMRPQSTQPQRFRVASPDSKLLHDLGPASGEVGRLYFKGSTTGLSAGELVLVVVARPGSSVQAVARRVRKVSPRYADELTEVEIEQLDGTAAANPEPVSTPDAAALAAAPSAPPIPFHRAAVEQHVLRRAVTEKDLQAFLDANRWSAEELASLVNLETANSTVEGQSVFAFRDRVGFFGNNAPAYQSLRNQSDNPLFPHDWDDDKKLHNSIWYEYGRAPAKLRGRIEIAVERPDVPGPYASANAYFDRLLQGVTLPSWTVFESSGQRHVYRVVSAAEAALVGFGMSGRVTGFKLAELSGDDLVLEDQFRIRRTTAHVKSEELTLAAMPLPDRLEAGVTRLALDRMILGLRPGQWVALTGERPDAPGVRSTEVLVLTEIVHYGGRTTLAFHAVDSESGLRHPYVRTSVYLNANVARATHGETKSEVAGSGDGAQGFQEFVLGQAPVTCLSSPTAAGIESTLEILVNGLRWHERRSFFQAPSLGRTFVTRRTEEGRTAVRFGDGTTGARLPTGAGNVTASYRVGLGTGGNVQDGQISLLLTRPLGVREVTNPVPASGGADPESREDARDNAPFSVRTLDRIVSLQDFEDYARAYPGIGKARAEWLWDGERKIVHLTVAAAGGGELLPGCGLLQNLRRSIAAARDPGVRVCLDSFRPLSFGLTARLRTAADWLPERVRAAAGQAVGEAFSFPRRALAQPVTRSEVFALLQNVEGVEAVDVDSLCFSGRLETLEAYLLARPASWSNDHRVILAAELLLVNPREIRLLEMSA